MRNDKHLHLYYTRIVSYMDAWLLPFKPPTPLPNTTTTIYSLYDEKQILPITYNAMKERSIKCAVYILYIATTNSIHFITKFVFIIIYMQL